MNSRYDERDSLEASVSLRQLCIESGWNPDLTMFRCLIDQGADVLYKRRVRNIDTILHRLIKVGNVKAVRLCMETRRDIDFTTKGYYQRTPLHVMSCVALSNANNILEILHAVLHRLETHPNDAVDWGLPDCTGTDFISYAAQNQKLSSFWPSVQHVPYFADQCQGIALSLVWEWDWMALEEKERSFFCLEPHTVMVAADRVTGQLCNQCREEDPDVDMVRRLVEEGADVLFLDPMRHDVPLLYFLKSGKLPCVEACLQTARGIDFTAAVVPTLRPLECCFFDFYSDDHDFSLLLECLLARLSSHGHHDRWDWALQDEQGLDFWFRCRGKLLLAWDILQKWNIPYFRHHRRRLDLLLAMKDTAAAMEVEEENELSASSRRRARVCTRIFRLQ